MRRAAAPTDARDSALRVCLSKSAIPGLYCQPCAPSPSSSPPPLSPSPNPCSSAASIRTSRCSTTRASAAPARSCRGRTAVGHHLRAASAARLVSDKLYEITPTCTQIVRPESVGGTPANRMIHRESKQLFIGPYAIDAKRNVRVIPPKQMFGRLTGNARHLTDPAGKIYYATMEEGIYEVDVKTLAVTELDQGRQRAKPADREAHPATIDSKLPGYHGKGLYSGQGRVVYANNGDHDARGARPIPTMPSGVLAEWEGQATTGSRAAQPVHRSHRARRHLRQRAARDRSGLEHRLGPSLAHPHAARRRQVARRSACRRRATATTARTAGTPSGRASATSARPTC